MGRNVFVSYKYSDAKETREIIRSVLGEEGHYYRGEKGFVALQNADSTIKEYLKDMIFNTSVTLVIISPQVRHSDWVDWEIRYSLRQTQRGGVTSYRNGILCVVQNNLEWSGRYSTNWASDNYGNYRKSVFPEAIIENLQTTFHSNCYYSDPFDRLLYSQYQQKKKDYCVIVGETEFKRNPSKYIEEAYSRAHDVSYEVVVNKQVF